MRPKARARSIECRNEFDEVRVVNDAYWRVVGHRKVVDVGQYVKIVAFVISRDWASTSLVNTGTEWLAASAATGALTS